MASDVEKLVARWRALANAGSPIANDYNAGQRWAYGVAAAELEAATESAPSASLTPEAWIVDRVARKICNRWAELANNAEPEGHWQLHGDDIRLDARVAVEEIAQILAEVNPAALTQPAASGEVVPAGWLLWTADFSLVASGRSPRGGRVMLVRDAAGKAWWHSLDEAAQETTPLYAYGYGATFAEAFSEASKDATSGDAAIDSAIKGEK